jgi:arsenite methyltransferase
MEGDSALKRTQAKYCSITDLDPAEGRMTTETRELDRIELEDRVKRMYEEVALEPEHDFHFETGRPLAERLGYPAADLDRIPAAALDSFAGVGYFLDLAATGSGHAVLDLGSGSGTDSFAAALRAGRIVGIDMTDAQLDKARTLAAEGGFNNVEFRVGYIEEAPVDDGVFDCVISNGVINLSPGKPAVFASAARALRPGGRLALADIVSSRRASPATHRCGRRVSAARCRGTATARRSREPDSRSRPGARTTSTGLRPSGRTTRRRSTA